MRVVKIGALKAHLSAHIRLVKEGEQVLVCERNRPVARIVPLPLRNPCEEETRLVSRGVLAPPFKERPSSWPQPPGNISDKVMQEVWREERESR